MLPSSPHALPDWSKHGYLLVGWPTRPDTWRERGAPAQAAIITFIRSVLKATNALRIVIVEDDSEPRPSTAEQKVAQLSKSHPAGQITRLQVLRLPMDDCWIRDTGPVMLSGKAGALFRFNAWGGSLGGCYDSVARDALAGGWLCERFGLTPVRSDMILEGGSVSTDGEGTVLTTKECLLNANRNPGLTETDIEGVLRATLGARAVVWLEHGAAFDNDTDGHVDNMAVFVAPGHVLLLWAEEDQCEEQHRRSRAALQTLRAAVDARGRRLTVSTVTMADRVVRSEGEAAGVDVRAEARGRPAGERVCASYVNVVVVEDTVFAPKFGHEGSDRRALGELQDAFGRYGKEVVMVDGRELVLAGGGLHCLTLGVPK